jgi:hypothetical protein
MTPHVAFFAGKAAPGYYIAKLIIRLITNVAKVVVRSNRIAASSTPTDLASTFSELGPVHRRSPQGRLHSRLQRFGCRGLDGEGRLQW